jgi:DNA-directed RNA polymerase specialized sigma24 family protein
MPKITIATSWRQTGGRDDAESSIRGRLQMFREIHTREIDDLSYKDIASAMSIPVGTLRSRVFRARDNLDHQVRRVCDAGLGRHTVQRAPR